jgi:hypothetical protein
MIKIQKNKISIEKEKFEADHQWDDYISQLIIENLDKVMLIHQITMMNIADYKYIKNKRKHYEEEKNG